MTPISTYVFLDLETSGLPKEELNKTKITEICLIAVKRAHVLDARPGSSPRVQQKITLCLNPGRLIAPSCTDVTGLSNDLLEYEPYFKGDVFTIINTFLSVLTKPVCLIAQNGFNFDFPILKAHLVKLGVSFAEDLICADCYHGFYDILEKKKKEFTSSIVSLKSTNESVNEIDYKDDVDYVNAMRLKNETTPKKLIMKSDRSSMKCEGVSKARRKFPWANGERPTEKYKLKDIYERVLKRPAVDTHRAENDCRLALEIAVALNKEFVQWVDDNHCPFTDVQPMKIGVPLGE